MSRLLCLALMLFGLGACGDSFHPTTPIPAPVAISCGEIILDATSSHATDSNAALQASQCLVQAYQKCAPSSLMIRLANTDITREFSVIAQPPAPCTLRQALQMDPNTPPAVADCKSAHIEKNTLTVEDCSHLGDFTLTP